VGPSATADAIVDALRRHEDLNGPYDLILFGNEAADTGTTKSAYAWRSPLGDRA